jgi:hypothetical protein
VYTKSVDRDGIFDALKSRRTYAATDHIFVDFALGDQVMGEEAVSAGPPEFTIAAEGTAPIARIDIIKDGTFAYTTSPNARTTKFTWRDQNFKADESYYYVRIIQSDKNMAWASPIWVRRK